MTTQFDKMKQNLMERRRQQAENSGGNNNTANKSDNAVFPFWTADNDTSTLIRFLPDGDTDNPFFWREKIVIKLPFNGIVGNTDKEVTVSVPCLEMYGMADPIIAETKPWWNDPSMKDLARRYWKNRSYIFQGFVVNSPVEEKNSPENPIRRFIINKTLFDIIDANILEFDNLPIEFENGRDFKITKTLKGQYSNYGTSNWAFKTRALNEEELTAIDEFGLNNLNDFLPKKPGPEEISIIKEMFHASVEGEPYDPVRWGNYYKPYGLNTSEGSSDVTESVRPVAKASTVSKAKTSKVVEEADDDDSYDDVAETVTEKKSEKPNVAELLKRINKNRTSE